MLYKVSRFIFAVSIKLFIKIRVKGKENFLKKEPFILVSNHARNLEPVLLGIACPRKIAFLAKEELFRLPVVGGWFGGVGCVPIRRKDSDILALKQSLRILRRKNPIVIFPQGARGSKEVKPGVGFLVKKSGVPVIPARIYGSDKVLPPGKMVPKRARVRIVVGRPLQIEGHKSPEIISSEVFNAIEALGQEKG